MFQFYEYLKYKYILMKKKTKRNKRINKKKRVRKSQKGGSGCFYDGYILKLAPMLTSPFRAVIGQIGI
tara:strand:- start:248 stop:451 length:204 start_codon:yes stop_codon:yes gene_type:complete